MRAVGFQPPVAMPTRTSGTSSSRSTRRFGTGNLADRVGRAPQVVANANDEALLDARGDLLELAVTACVAQHLLRGCRCR